jgi:sugar phosphate isomerase/epimerase
MQIQFFYPRWGSEHLSWDEFCRKVRQEGYDGIEYAIAGNTSEGELNTVWNTAAKHNLKVIAQHYDTYTADFSIHHDRYARWFQKVTPFQPVKINSQTGKDFFSFSQNKQLIDTAAQSGIPVVHETHRNKFSFAAHITHGYLEKLPALRLTLDVSHWVCVAESFLDDQVSALDLAIERTEHIHARVGHTSGPQVSDPRATEWQEAVNKHLSWWDKVVSRKRKEPKGVLTITPEFGPFPYMVHVPATGAPVADQWEVNTYIMRLLKKRYS